MYDQKNGCLDFDDEIEIDGQEFITLPEGDYNFTVTGVERGRFPGSKKLPSCNKVTLSLRVDTDDGAANVKTDLIMYKSLEWKISAFFRSIGMKKHGERIKMDWNKAENAEGRAHFKPRKYIGKDGEERTTNDVERFLDWDEKYFTDSTDTDDLPF